MVRNMAPEEFEELLALYGTEPQEWPAPERTKAEAFSKTEEGARILSSERALEQSLKQMAAEQEAGFDTNAEPFLARLADIPVYNKQAFNTPEKSAGGWFGNVLNAGFDFLAVGAFASRAAVFAGVLGVGMVVGMSSVQETVEYADYDVSNVWAIDNSGLEEMVQGEGS